MKPEIIELFFLSDLYSEVRARVVMDNEGNERNMKTLYIEDESDILNIVNEALENNSVVLSDDSLVVLKSGDAIAILDFLKEQSQAAAALSKSYHEQTAATLATLPMEKHKAFEEFLYDTLWYAAPIFDTAVPEVLLHDTAAFSQRLVFKGLELEDYRNDSFLTAFVFLCSGEKYVVELLQTDYADEGRSIHLASIFFEDFVIQNACYNYFDAGTGSHGHLAWSLVESALQSMKFKHDLLGVEYLNEAEKELLPELQSFTYERYRKAAALPIWYSIRQRLFDATSAYPHREDKQLAFRNEVEKAILDAGFSGKYPHFYKTADIDGYKLRLIHNTPYLYNRDKNVLSIIDIIETRHGILLVSGIILNKRADSERLGETSSLEAFFDDGPYRIGKYLTLPTYELNAEGADKNALIAKAVGAILKLSALERLTKQELSELPVTSVTTSLPLRVLIFISLAFGVAFSLLFCAGMAILCFIIGVIFGEGAVDGFGLLSSIPWHQFLLFAALGAGGLMSVIMALAKDK